jgi:hypothetical protein
MRSLASFAIAAMLAALGGCGLISSDVTQFDLTLPEKTFTVDTSQWMLKDVGTFTSVSCASDPNLCESAVQSQSTCKPNQCTGSCDASTKTCDLSVLVSLYQMIDLVAEKPELKTINDQPLVGVHIDKLEYEVTENSLNVDTPELAIYVAPATVMAPGDPQASLIAMVPPVPAGMTQGLMPIDIGADGQAALAAKMGDYKTPFNIIIGSTLVVKMGDKVPTGRLTAKVKITAHANLGG